METWQKILLSLIIIGEVVGIIIFVSAKDYETAKVGWMMGLFFLLIPSVGSVCYSIWRRQHQQEQRREIELDNVTQNNTISTGSTENLEREIANLEKKKRIAELKKEISDLENQVASTSATT